MRVDGREQPQLMADWGLSSVAVTAGHHVVTKAYRPRPPLVGFAASLLTALALAFFRLPR